MFLALGINNTKNKKKLFCRNKLNKDTVKK